MKKLLITFITLICLTLPVLAGNIQQQEFETQMYGNTIDEPISYNKNYLFLNDYQGYLNGGRSGYGYLLALQADYKNKPDTDINKRYVNLMLQRYNLAIKNKNNLFISKIIIDDADYQKITQDVKIAIAMYNLMAN